MSEFFFFQIHLHYTDTRYNTNMSDKLIGGKWEQNLNIMFARHINKFIKLKLNI